MSLLNTDYSPTELMDAVKIDAPHKTISIGMALDALVDLDRLGTTYKGGLDGIDALCYHLDIYTVRDAIKALQHVEQRFSISK